VSWLFDLHRTQPIAHAVGVLAFVCVPGMAFGSWKFHGIGLGTAGVLFAGILVGHFRRGGGMTDPPALAFASDIAGSDAPTVAYATVYPLTTLLRILSAQVLAIILFR